MIAGRGDANMSTRQAKPGGWAAFDLQQRRKGIIEPQSSSEPFPSLPSTLTSLQPLETFSRNMSMNRLSVKPFSSVIVPSANCPVSVGDKKKSKPYDVGGSADPQSSDVPQESKLAQNFRRLKELYSWADDGLIEDILEAANNEFDKASSFFSSIFSDENLGKNENNKAVKSRCDSMRPVNNDMHGKRFVSPHKISETSNTCSMFDSCVGDNKNLTDEFACQAGKPLDSWMGSNSLLVQSTCVPIEPEWEEDDVYLSCRKDAIKILRAATRHSKAATNSYLKGDHFSAQKFSLKARKEWEASERLNAKAALEIFSIRNENNGIWRLDLHGLHAAEAIQALQERLDMIETQVFLKGASTPGFPYGFRTKAASEQMLAARKPMWLEVITGIGNHSRGGAALPVAVKTFLVDNGYRFDEARPGVIVVRPKIRHV